MSVKGTGPLAERGAEERKRIAEAAEESIYEHASTKSSLTLETHPEHPPGH